MKFVVDHMPYYRKECPYARENASVYRCSLDGKECNLDEVDDHNEWISGYRSDNCRWLMELHLDY